MAAPHRAPDKERKISFAEVKASERRERERKDAVEKAALAASTPIYKTAEEIVPLETLENVPEGEEERQTLFSAMLTHFELQPDAKWNDYVIYFSKDARYKLVKGQPTKLRLFREHMARVKAEFDQGVLTKAKGMFERFLEENKSNLVACLTIEAASKQYGDAPGWACLDNYSDVRKELFENYVKELEVEIAATKERFLNEAHREAFHKTVEDKLAKNELKLEFDWDTPEMQSHFVRDPSVVFFQGTDECKQIFDKVVAEKREIRLKELADQPKPDPKAEALAKEIQAAEEEIKGKLGNKKILQKVILSKLALEQKVANLQGQTEGSKDKKRSRSRSTSKSIERWRKKVLNRDSEERDRRRRSRSRSRERARKGSPDDKRSKREASKESKRKKKSSERRKRSPSPSSSSASRSRSPAQNSSPRGTSSSRSPSPERKKKRTKKSHKKHKRKDGKKTERKHKNKSGSESESDKASGSDAMD